jgi:hypothetical protein
MPAPRLPKMKADVSGASIKNPKRHADRKAPATGAIGPAPAWMGSDQAAMWATFVSEVPWLDASHRSVLEIAVTIRARLASGAEVGVQALNLLRQCLGQLGATPADASKVTLPDADEEDPDDRFFN